MNVSDVKWIKLDVSMFDNRKIKYLRKMDDGNLKVLVWVMLLTIAGKCNAGGDIFITESVMYDTESLANELDVFEDYVKEALQAFEDLNMIERDFKTRRITILNWEEYQNIEGLEHIREQNRIRKQRERERKVSRDSHVTVTQEVTPCHATDIDIRNKNKNTIEKEGKKESPSGYENIISELVTGEDLKETLREFIKARKLLRKPMTDRALKMMIKKLRELAIDEKTQIAILEQSIRGGWTDVYPLKENGYKGDFRTQKYNPALDYQHSDSLMDAVKDIGKDFFADLDGGVEC